MDEWPVRSAGRSPERPSWSVLEAQYKEYIELYNNYDTHIHEILLYNYEATLHELLVN